MKTIIIEPKDNNEFEFFFELAKRLGANVRVYEEEAPKLSSLNPEEETTENKKPDNIVLDTISEILTGQGENAENHS
jgi:hypothetical protein